MDELEQQLDMMVGGVEHLLKRFAKSETMWDSMADIALKSFRAFNSRGFNVEQSMQLTLAVVSSLANPKK